MIKKWVVVLCFLALNSPHAALIAIVDSGNDFLHKDLKDKVYINPQESTEDRDGDHNGYPGDIHGWNFAEGNNQLIDYQYKTTDTPDVELFFKLQLKMLNGTLTKEEYDWMKTQLNNPDYLKKLQTFGNWAHGTHVSGITVKDNSRSKVMGIKIIPTVSPLEKFSGITGTKDEIIKKLLQQLAITQGALFGEIGHYLKPFHVDIVNGSFGTSYSQMAGLFKMLYSKIFKTEPTAEQLDSYLQAYFAQALVSSRQVADLNPNTLFIFAAGNDGANNDLFPISPGNIEVDNKITVAATLGSQSLAKFSNYGEKNVDVAAPGVGIISSIPMDRYLPLSGTSQASPYVAGIALAVKELNSKLSPLEIKEIIMKTVDQKSWLQGKVKSGGLVNKERAIWAAKLSLRLSLDEAISKSWIAIRPVNEKLLAGPRLFEIDSEFILPLPSTIY